MKKVVVLILLSLIIYGVDRVGWLAFPKGIFEKALSFRITSPLSGLQNQELQKLKEENTELLSKIVDQRNLINENQALRTQLGAPQNLPAGRQKFLPAKVLGGTPNFLIIDKGKTDNVRLAQTVVYKNILVGKIISLSENRARVELPTAGGSKISGKTERGALGIVVSQGDSLFLDQVTLSDNLSEKDLVFTAGSIDEQGQEEGLMPDLLIGEVTKVFKSESALFQQAQLKSPLDFKSLEIVFLVI